MTCKSTDLGSPAPEGITEEQKSKAAEALAMTAGHLASVDPDKDVDEFTFAVLVGAKVYDIGGRSGRSGGVRIVRQALEAVGEVPSGGVTRVEFAVPVARAAQALGYDWSKNDNRQLAAAVAG
ncbi:hypothetical protein [Streptomyces sp. NPDC018693]|uniref:hypothetical protein n=1 Tax=unclassified Streptomyces TaxID=2593676 RepID=UPI00379A5309